MWLFSFGFENLMTSHAHMSVHGFEIHVGANFNFDFLKKCKG